MFTFWNINPKWALMLSTILPGVLILEGLVNGALVSEPLATALLAAVLFYIVNGVLKLVDELL